MLSLDFRPLEDIDVEPRTPHGDVRETVGRILASRNYERAKDYFKAYPGHSLLFDSSRAFLYELVRETKPSAVLEIGTYRAGTAEVLARALWANRQGIVVTVDPFPNAAPEVISAWPAPLRDHVAFVPASSMNFFMDATDKGLRFDLAFIDGNHDYAYAAYDLDMAADRLNPGGVIVLDNFDQPGPFWAVKQFLARNPGWREAGRALETHDATDPFGSIRPSIPDTSFIVLAGPDRVYLTELPMSFDQQVALADVALAGFTLAPTADCPAGMLHSLVYFRSFQGLPQEPRFPEELMAVDKSMVAAGAEPGEIALSRPLVANGLPSPTLRKCEIVLTWQPLEGSQALRLIEPPRPITQGMS